MLIGTFSLLRIDAVTTFSGTDGGKLKSTYWTDNAGEIMKCRVDELDQTIHRTTREFVQVSAEPAEVDLGWSTTVPVDRPIAEVHRARHARYRVELRDGDPASTFVSDAIQKVTSTGPHTAEIVVTALTPDDAGRAPRTTAREPTIDDRRPSGLIQSDDPRVVALAAEAVGNETDPARVAVLLERFVHERIKNKNFSQVFASAAEVAKSLEGDCTEHAVLLAAMARARGLPARVALGLVYMGREPAFGFHMWTEVSIADHWVPLDGTLGLGRIGTGHLKLANSSLADSAGWGSLLSVATVLGRLKIAVVEVE
jgi:transglutaminase-like putative cysteine protease